MKIASKFIRHSSTTKDIITMHMCLNRVNVQDRVSKCLHTLRVPNAP